jgi:formamidopyrimidine-DNA glycosylase
MPELPEVETVARGLQRFLIGRTIIGVQMDWLRSIAAPSPSEFAERLVGRRVESIGRRGKYVVIHLDVGYLMIHLKMSGRLRVVPGAQPADKHVHVTFTLDNGMELRFHDVRKFGRVYLVDDMTEVTSHLGPEPLSDDFTLSLFRRLLERRTGRLKSLLLNQEFLAGLGNIYADEALFAAHLHPLRKADTLTPNEQESLYHAIRTVLRRAVASRGTTLTDGGYTDAEGQSGAYQDQVVVYGQAGKPCPQCETPIERLIIGGRSSHYCPRCQLPMDSDRPM